MAAGRAHEWTCVKIPHTRKRDRRRAERFGQHLPALGGVSRAYGVSKDVLEARERRASQECLSNIISVENKSTYTGACRSFYSSCFARGDRSFEARRGTRGCIACAGLRLGLGESANEFLQQNAIQSIGIGGVTTAMALAHAVHNLVGVLSSAARRGCTKN